MFKLKPNTKTLCISLFETYLEGTNKLVAKTAVDPFSLLFFGDASALPKSINLMSVSSSEIYCNLLFDSRIEDSVNITENSDLEHQKQSNFSLIQARQEYLT